MLSAIDAPHGLPAPSRARNPAACPFGPVTERHRGRTDERVLTEAERLRLAAGGELNEPGVTFTEVRVRWCRHALRAAEHLLWHDHRPAGDGVRPVVPELGMRGRGGRGDGRCADKQDGARNG